MTSPRLFLLREVRLLDQQTLLFRLPLIDLHEIGGRHPTDAGALSAQPPDRQSTLALAAHPHFQQTSNRGEFLAPKLAGLIGVEEQVLRLFRFGFGNLHRQGDRNEPGFDSGHQPFLTTLE